MKNIFALNFLLISSISFAQVYISDYSNSIHKVDPGTCTIESQFKVGVDDTLTDLAIRADGQLYGITANGKLYQINPETADVLLIHSFLNLQSFEALYCSDSGIIYVGGSEGFLYTYEIGTKTDVFVGDLGDISIDDLLLYAGEIYGSTRDKKLLHIDIDNPSQSNIIMDVSAETSMQGLFTAQNTSNLCDIQSMIGISSGGIIYQIDTKLNTTIEICDLGINASGATSIQDLFRYTPLQILDYSTRASQCKADNGMVEIDAQGGIGAIQYGMNDQDYQAENIRTNIRAGNHSIQVKDDNGCVVSIDNITIAITEDPVIEDLVITKPICAEGKGSLIVMARGVSALEYSIDGINFQPEEKFSDIGIGHYDLFVQDSNGCQTTKAIEFTPEGQFKIKEIKKVAATCNTDNGEIEIVLSEQYTDLSYFLDQREQTTAFFDEVAAGPHMITITQGEYCQIDTNVVLNSDVCPVFIPNAFSPDHDGVNDDFRIYTSAQNEVMVKSYQIFDRWGGKIYEATNFSIHDENHWWDGKLNQSNITQGLYVYVIDLTHQDGSVEHLQGQLSIL